MMCLKHKSSNLKHGKGKRTSGPNGQLSKSAKTSKTKPGWGEGELALYLVMWLGMCLFKIYKIAIFEVDASLKWMPEKSKFKSGTCITERKANRQGLHYSYLK